MPGKFKFTLANTDKFNQEAYLAAIHGTRKLKAPPDVYVGYGPEDMGSAMVIKVPARQEWNLVLPTDPQKYTLECGFTYGITSRKAVWDYVKPVLLAVCASSPYAFELYWEDADGGDVVEVGRFDPITKCILVSHKGVPTAAEFEQEAAAQAKSSQQRQQQAALQQQQQQQQHHMQAMQQMQQPAHGAQGRAGVVPMPSPMYQMPAPQTRLQSPMSMPMPMPMPMMMSPNPNAASPQVGRTQVVASRPSPPQQPQQSPPQLQGNFLVQQQLMMMQAEAQAQAQAHAGAGMGQARPGMAPAGPLGSPMQPPMRGPPMQGGGVLVPMQMPMGMHMQAQMQMPMPQAQPESRPAAGAGGGGGPGGNKLTGFMTAVANAVTGGGGGSKTSGSGAQPQAQPPSARSAPSGMGPAPGGAWGSSSSPVGAGASAPQRPQQMSVPAPGAAGRGMPTPMMLPAMMGPGGMGPPGVPPGAGVPAGMRAMPVASPGRGKQG